MRVVMRTCPYKECGVYCQHEVILVWGNYMIVQCSMCKRVYDYKQRTVEIPKDPKKIKNTEFF